MSGFRTKEELHQQIGAYYEQMASRKMSVDELEELVNACRELYERSLILRHKAYEEELFARSEQEKEPEEEILPEQEIASVSEEKEEEAETVYDFSLFDDSNENTAETKEQEEALSTEQNPESEESTEAEELEGAFEDEVSGIETDEEEEIAKADYPEEVVSEEKEEVNETVETEPEISEGDEGDQMFREILKRDDSLASVLMGSKLDSLKGAFGFNERFQCVQELFKGSTEDFEQAIEVLDSQANFDEAKKQLVYYVRLNKWDLEKELVASFVRKVERRYS
ncbi:MAG: hypothetical protein EP338_03755 [Bacteroidetes bacterium]|nr:MAG: hypothetical protein EP338_03755 [Bacteroidota bacterium]